jgi:hypothetical protein
LDALRDLVPGHVLQDLVRPLPKVKVEGRSLVREPLRGGVRARSSERIRACCRRSSATQSSICGGPMRRISGSPDSSSSRKCRSSVTKSVESCALSNRAAMDEPGASEVRGFSSRNCPRSRSVPRSARCSLVAASSDVVLVWTWSMRDSPVPAAELGSGRVRAHRGDPFLLISAVRSTST